MDACRIYCLTEIIIATCGCATSQMYEYTDDRPGIDVCLSDLCDYDKVYYQAKCIRAVMDGDHDCSHCNQPRCDSWSYQPSHESVKHFTNQLSADTLSGSYLPDDHVSLDDMIYEYGNISNIPASFISENYILVNIFFNHLRLTKKEAKAVIKPFGLISSLGGALGLWAGFSILTLMELMEWLIRILISIRSRKIVTSETEKA